MSRTRPNARATAAVVCLAAVALFFLTLFLAGSSAEAGVPPTTPSTESTATTEEPTTATTEEPTTASSRVTTTEGSTPSSRGSTTTVNRSSTTTTTEPPSSTTTASTVPPSTAGAPPSIVAPEDPLLPKLNNAASSDGLSTDAKLALVVGGLLVVATAIGVLTYLYWRRTRPEPYHAALDALALADRPSTDVPTPAAGTPVTNLASSGAPTTTTPTTGATAAAGAAGAAGALAGAKSASSRTASSDAAPSAGATTGVRILGPLDDEPEPNGDGHADEHTDADESDRADDRASAAEPSTSDAPTNDTPTDDTPTNDAPTTATEPAPPLDFGTATDAEPPRITESTGIVTLEDLFGPDPSTATAADQASVSPDLWAEGADGRPTDEGGPATPPTDAPGVRTTDER